MNARPAVPEATARAAAMDATEWEVFLTQTEALQRAIELTREYEGNED